MLNFRCEGMRKLRDFSAVHRMTHPLRFQKLQRQTNKLQTEAESMLMSPRGEKSECSIFVQSQQIRRHL